ncbi:hypothetical protein [uncultured Sphingomonas sp.]|uniref:hypothetical protein n=1 Tax=uncultured Sphingomonas sp. TaxID=158754 RepID=UPI0025E274F2|nr:hypothetical protein [uncultured Sphingomonas sp.]
MRIVDWVARTTMLVLAALATLALIGSLASVSNSPIGQVFPGQVAVQEPPAPDSLPTSAGAPPASADAESPENAVAMRTVATAERIAAQRETEVARWLKALTYAVIALAAFAAAGVVALVRIGGHLARIADR